jgi:hypothetical protein
MNFGSGNLMDDVVIGCSPSALSPKTATHHACNTNAGSSSAPTRQQHINGHELRRSRRKQQVEEEEATGSEDDSEDSELDSDWVDSDNELAADDDDIYEEWVDDKFEERKKSKPKWEQDSDYDTDDDLEELQGSDMEDANSSKEVEVVDKKGRKSKRKSTSKRGAQRT